MPIQIDSITTFPQFIPELASWHDQEWRHLNPTEYTIDFRMKEYEQCLSSTKIPMMLVAHENDRPLGSVRLINNDMDTHLEWFPWMASLFVHKDLRGKGIGTSLIKAIEQKARSFGYDKLYLFTEDQHALYKKLGWQILVNETYYGENISVMIRDLTSL